MLAEGFVALIALVTVMIASSSELVDASGKALSPGTIYGNGIGRFLTLLIGPENLPFAITFGAMAFSTFVFDTLDVATRLGRYIVQELTGWRGKAGAFAGTVATVLPAVLILGFAEPGSWKKFWTLFGASNQLLAGMTLVAVAAWLKEEGKSRAFVLIPMGFVVAITLWALGSLAISSFRDIRDATGSPANGVVALVLIALALFLLASGWRRRGSRKPASGSSAPQST
jgi:carbon starvation protein